VGRWPFPARRLRRASSLRACSSRRMSTHRVRCVSFEDTPWIARPFDSVEPKFFRLPGSSLGVSSKTAPPSTSALYVHSRSPGARDLPDPVLVPPLPFLPASTVYSVHHLAGLFHPATDHGVHLVSSRNPTYAELPTLPTGAPPFEAFPSQVAVSLSPGPLPSRCCFHTAEAVLPPNLRAFFHRRVRCVQAVLPLPFCPMLPWAFHSTPGSHRRTGVSSVSVAMTEAMACHTEVSPGGTAFQQPPLRMAP
jgi:hypothetical protein